MTKEYLENILSQLNKLTQQVNELINKEEPNDDLEEIITNPCQGLYHLKAGDGYNDNVDLLCRLENTGNGYIAFFPSYCNSIQDNYICLAYDEAEYLRKLLTYEQRNESS